jgi:radical SAM family uncharacterized protein/radical SAM-linked protein
MEDPRQPDDRTDSIPAARAGEAPTIHPYQEFLHRVNKPARYTGGEVGSVVKPWTDEVTKICLAFPDVYDIGMSHLGFKILYKILNDDPRTLAERCYAPWVDMEAELRKRGLPLISLESHRPLRDFDVVGFSLQFELTYTNVLSMLELGKIPLRSADRADSDPLIIAGGPTATHPEPLAPFLDAVVIGDGEAKATEVALQWAALRREGVPRRERLEALARLGAVYVPSLYETEIDPDTGLSYVARSIAKGAPLPISRALVDINDYPFPDEGPTGGPEAIFDRMSIEIARGCTEGCRFCQAGMIYRPVRERDPADVVDTVLRAVEKSGHDEVSLTALSTADVSCISPLIKQVATRLSEKRISLGVSSLRAYGLAPELLDELGRVRAAGLTFAPEAGTQRMRDVVNKNVTEEQLLETAERVFSRNWGRMKLYFMIGLPTETDDDVRGTVGTGARTLAAGKSVAKKGRPPEVTVSVSTHVPKPHTPFQWCAMDTLTEVYRKQDLLREEARKHKGLKLKTHDADASVLEGVFARGDRRLADVLERAFRNGARFDSWDDQLDLSIWKESFETFGIRPADYLGTIPVSAKLPWDHIDVGLEEGFLAREYKKALKSRLSPPCGKVAGQFVHHEDLAVARADDRRLVCYDCGVACDMTKMRSERISMLERMSSGEPSKDVVRLPMATGRSLRSPGEPRGGHRVRFRFQKIGQVAMLGHLDLVRELPRIFRRLGVELEYSLGFHPKPEMIFSPALSLGLLSLDEYVDVRLSSRPDEGELPALLERMTHSSPEGLFFTGAAVLGPGDPSISKIIGGARYAVVMSRGTAAEAAGVPAHEVETWLAAQVRASMDRSELPVRRPVGKGQLSRMIDARAFLRGIEVIGPIDNAAPNVFARAGLMGDLVGLEVEVAIRQSGAVKLAEVVTAVLGEQAPSYLGVRTQLFGLFSGEITSPLDLERARSGLAAATAATANAGTSVAATSVTATSVEGP